MQRVHIKQLRQYSPSQKLGLLKHIPSTNSPIDRVSEEVWGILSKEQKSEIEALLQGRIEALSFGTKRKVYNVLRMVTSLVNHPGEVSKNIHNIIAKQMNNPGLALEFFIVDAISRYGKKRIHKSESSAEVRITSHKAPLEFDRKHKVDFLTEVKDGDASLDIGVQLTTSTSPRIKTKQSDMEFLRGKIDDTQKDIFSGKRYTDGCDLDMGVLMIVNGSLGRSINDEGRDALQKAFITWSRERRYTSGGPNNCIKGYKMKKSIASIGGTYPFVVHAALNFITNPKLFGETLRHPLLVRETDNERFYLEYNAEEQTIEISYRRKRLTKQRLKKTSGEEIWIEEYTYPKDFDYSVKFFITDKLLQKLGVQIKRKKGESQKGKRSPSIKKKRKKYPRTKPSIRSH